MSYQKRKQIRRFRRKAAGRYDRNVTVFKLNTGISEDFEGLPAWHASCSSPLCRVQLSQTQCAQGSRIASQATRIADFGRDRVAGWLLLRLLWRNGTLQRNAPSTGPLDPGIGRGIGRPEKSHYRVPFVQFAPSKHATSGMGTRRESLATVHRAVNPRASAAQAANRREINR